MQCVRERNINVPLDQFLNLNTIDSLEQIIRVMGDVLRIAQCLAASLASIYQMSATPIPPDVATKNVCRCCQVSATEQSRPTWMHSPSPVGRHD